MAYERQQRGPAPRRAGGGVPDALLIGTLGALVGLTLLVWTATGLAGLLSNGGWPSGVTFVGTAPAIRSLLTAPRDVAAAWPEADPAALPGANALWLVFLAQLAVLFALTLWISFRVARWRAHRGRPRPAAPPVTPPPAERPAQGPVERPAGRRSRRAPAPRAPAPVPAPVDEPAGPAVPRRLVEPAPQAPAPEAALPVPAPVSVPVPGREPVAAVLDAPEGLVVIDPSGHLWDRTARQRGRRGPVHVYDPGHATDAPVRLRWAPHRGCEEMPVARRRAAALLGPVRPSEPIFQLDADTAETMLRCYLHAAALSGEPFPQVQRWAHGRAAGEAGKVLRTHTRAAGGAAMELESALTGHPARRDAALKLIERALSGLEQLHIRQACAPGRVDTLALDNVAGEGATLYIVGDHKETAGLRAGLAEALRADQPTLTFLDPAA
ncbi:type VI secretion protein [Streptomyces sp. DSM 44917]|uniref:Type VI secretion protein n=1 Tax=Streptomyces boetiae TaxID=3075541 RepID=A0ABU2LC71_9ACTN|nr:type VI secretion protein [Streptomyces sp. DSM 44917]MDT0309105.1 type VI secretion protein [Streptomyces sp. DSM 44917]